MQIILYIMGIVSLLILSICLPVVYYQRPTLKHALGGLLIGAILSFLYMCCTTCLCDGNPDRLQALSFPGFCTVAILIPKSRNRNGSLFFLFVFYLVLGFQHMYLVGSTRYTTKPYRLMHSAAAYNRSAAKYGKSNRIQFTFHKAPHTWFTGLYPMIYREYVLPTQNGTPVITKK